MSFLSDKEKLEYASALQLVETIGPYLDPIDTNVLKEFNDVEFKYFLKILQEYSERGVSHTQQELQDKDFVRIPVGIEEFLEDEQYLGGIGKDIYPELKRQLKAMFDNSQIVEICLTGCFTGDTKISLLDGTERSFEELYKEGKKEFWVYSCTPEGEIKPCKVTDGVQLTKYVTELVEVTLDNGEKVRCTPDHKWMLRDGSYKRAMELTSGDSLMVRGEKFCRGKRVLRIASTERIKEPKEVPVYCVEVQDPVHNFSLSSGAVVHNSIGWGKSFLSRVIGMRMLYWISCLKNPQEYLGLAKGEPIMLCNLSVTGGKSDEFFQNLKNMIDISAYFQEHFPRYKKINSAMIFPNNVSFVSAGGHEQGVIGSNVLFCFTGDTKISLLDGTERSFEELVKNHANEEFWVYSSEEDGNVVPGLAHSPRITRYVTELVEVTLDNGEKVRCTPDHKWMLRDGLYKEAKDLTSTDSLMLLNQKAGKRVVSVKRVELKKPIPVYCMTVEKYNNFALSAGVFVHNCIMDEVNFMRKTKNSVKKLAGKEEYDQAMQLYDAILRRMKSRFLFHGKSPGKVVVVSSKRYPNDFLENHIKSIRGKKDVLVLDYATWDVKPKDSFSGLWFQVYLGDGTLKPRILQAGETVNCPEEQIVRVPEEYRDDFERDLPAALRDIAGVATLGSNLFIVNTDVVKKCFHDRPLPVNYLRTDLNDGFRIEPEELFHMNNEGEFLRMKYYPNSPRYLHFDLSKTICDTGLAMGCFGGYKPIERTGLQGKKYIQQVPIVWIDFAFAITTDPDLGEVNQNSIANFIFSLRELGVPLQIVSSDSYQNVGIKQTLTTGGITTEEISTVKDTKPFLALKENILAQAFNCHTHKSAMKEIQALEVDPKTGKVDKPPGGSKDIADSLAGVAYHVVTNHSFVEDILPEIQQDDSTFMGSEYKDKIQNPEFHRRELEDLSEEDRFLRQILS